jgi:tetratricopeptide (TPR) repeat protein
VKRSVKKLGIAFGAMVVLVVLGEIACRVLFPSETQRDIEEQLADPKPAGTFRVLAVGGSSVAGLPIRDFGFVAQLEALLLHLRPEAALEVANFGKGARSSKSVRDVVEATADLEPDLVIVYTGHNEFLFRAGSGGLGEDVLVALRGSALYRTGTKALAKLRGPRTDPEYVLPKELRPYERTGEWWASRVALYRENLDALIETCASRGTPLLLSTVVSNDVDWPPVHEAIAWALDNPDYDADVARIEALLDEDRSEEALEELGGVLSTFGDDAMMHWLAGRALLALGRPADAKPHFHLARELDPYPWRALPAFNDHLRGLADRPGVTLVDAERVFEEHDDDGLIGRELVSDNCHPTPTGSALVALALAGAMRDQALFLAPDTELPDTGAWLETFYATFDEARLEHLRTAYLRDNGIYSMKTPFRHYDAARRYFDEGVAFAPDDWRTWANYGALSLLDGDRERALEQLARAQELKGEPLDALADRPSVPYLMEATVRAGVELDPLPTE